MIRKKVIFLILLIFCITVSTSVICAADNIDRNETVKDTTEIKEDNVDTNIPNEVKSTENEVSNGNSKLQDSSSEDKLVLHNITYTDNNVTFNFNAPNSHRSKVVHLIINNKSVATEYSSYKAITYPYYKYNGSAFNYTLNCNDYFGYYPNDAWDEFYTYDLTTGTFTPLKIKINNTAGATYTFNEDVQIFQNGVQIDGNTLTLVNGNNNIILKNIQNGVPCYYYISIPVYNIIMNTQIFTYGSSGPLIATLYKNNVACPDELITFTINGKTYSNRTNSKGQAKILLTNYKPATYTIHLSAMGIEKFYNITINNPTYKYKGYSITLSPVQYDKFKQLMKKGKDSDYYSVINYTGKTATYKAKVIVPFYKKNKGKIYDNVFIKQDKKMLNKVLKNYKSKGWKSELISYRSNAVRGKYIKLSFSKIIVKKYKTYKYKSVTKNGKSYLSLYYDGRAGECYIAYNIEGHGRYYQGDEVSHVKVNLL